MREIRTSSSMRGRRKRATAQRACALLYRSPGDSAAVLFAMQQEPLAKFVAVAAAGFHGGQHLVAFVIVYRGFQVGCHIILGVNGQNESEDDAISLLTRHVVHPVSGVRRLLTHARWNA